MRKWPIERERECEGVSKRLDKMDNDGDGQNRVQRFNPTKQNSF
jgi:hypothetical protein